MISDTDKKRIEDLRSQLERTRDYARSLERDIMTNKQAYDTRIEELYAALAKERAVPIRV